MTLLGKHMLHLRKHQTWQTLANADDGKKTADSKHWSETTCNPFMVQHECSI